MIGGQLATVGCGLPIMVGSFQSIIEDAATVGPTGNYQTTSQLAGQHTSFDRQSDALSLRLLLIIHFWFLLEESVCENKFTKNGLSRCWPSGCSLREGESAIDLFTLQPLAPNEPSTPLVRPFNSP